MDGGYNHILPLVLLLTKGNVACAESPRRTHLWSRGEGEGGKEGRGRRRGRRSKEEKEEEEDQEVMK